MPIAIERADGGVSILRLLSAEVDPDAEVAKWEAAAEPGWLPIARWANVPEDSIPADRQHRAAWKLSGKAVEPDAGQSAAIDRDAAIHAIDAQCQAAIAQGFQFAGKTFSLSAAAQMNWTNLDAKKAAFTYPVEVSTKDDGAHSLASAAEVSAFCMTALLTVKAALDAARAAKAALAG